VDVEFGLKETKANEERFALLREQLDALLKQARSALDAVIEEELHAAASAHLGDKGAIADYVIPRLEKAVKQWRDNCSAELDKLIASADAEVEARSESPGATKVHDLFEEDAEEPERQTLPGMKKIVNSLAEKAQSGLRKYHEKLMGMKLDKAREELRKFDEAKTFEAYSAAAKGAKKPFGSLEKIKQARPIVTFHMIADVAGPFVLELGTLIGGEIGQIRLEKKRLERRQKLRDKIRQVAGKVGNNAWQDWEVRANEFKAWLSQSQGAAHTMSEPLDEELGMLNASKEDFARLVAE
jgi:hypothetical protein